VAIYKTGYSSSWWSYLSICLHQFIKTLADLLIVPKTFCTHWRLLPVRYNPNNISSRPAFFVLYQKRARVMPEQFKDQTLKPALVAWRKRSGLGIK
jgi:hypothetical protein